MQFQHSHEVSASPAEVLRLLCDPEYQKAKAERLGAHGFTISDSSSGHERTIVTGRTLATAGLPEFVKAMVTPTMHVTETERWHVPLTEEGIKGSFHIDVEGAPVRLRGAVSITPSGNGSTVCFSGQWTATVPLFRSRVEQASVSSIYEATHAEFALLEEWAAAVTV